MNNVTEASDTLNRWSGTKVATFENLDLFEEMGPVEVKVTEDMIKAYAFAMDDYHLWHLDNSPFGGPIAPAALLANDLLNVKYAMYDRMTVVGLHTEEELTFHAPVPVGETVTVTGRYSEKTERRGQGHAVMEAEARDSSGRLLVSHRNSEITRVNPGSVVGRGSAGSAAGRVTPETLDVPPIAEVRDAIEPGTPIVGKSTLLSQAQMSVYSYVGEFERNFHNDLHYAQEHGLDTTIAQGLQTFGYFSDVCTSFFRENWFTSGWIKAKFLLPVYPNSRLAVSGKVVQQERMNESTMKTHLELWVRDQDQRLVTVGWASASSRIS